MDQIEDIKKRLNIVDIISGYLPIKKAGRNFRALCPFHPEKTPSFMISPEKQIYYCFGCNKGGDVINFVQEMEHLDFMETLEMLASKAGVVLEKKDFGQRSEKDKYFRANEAVASLYHKILISDRGVSALEYFRDKRGLDDETIKKFQLGFAPASRDLLSNFSLKYKIDKRILFDLGLIVPTTRGSMDRFRERLIFPLIDTNNKVVGFAGRIFGKDSPDFAKYVNSPNSIIYNKSHFIYGLCFARDAIKEKDQAVVAEGNMDVIACHQAGFLNTVCSSGTALAQEQLNILKRYTNNIILAFDSDNAGQRAVERALELASGTDLNIKIVVSTDGKDPDEIIKKDPSLWQKALDASLYPIEYLWQLAKAQHPYPFDTTTKKQLARKIAPFLSKISDPIEKDDWVKKTADFLGIREEALRDTLGAAPPPSSFSQATLPERTINEILEEEILRILLAEPDLISEFRDKISALDFSNQECGMIYKQADLYYNNKDKFNYQDFRAGLDPNLAKITDRLALAKEFLDKGSLQGELEEVIKRRLGLKNDAKKSRLALQIKQAEDAGNKELVKELIEKYGELREKNEEN